MTERIDDRTLYQRKWRENNPIVWKQYMKKYRIENKEKIAKSRHEWYLKNKCKKNKKEAERQRNNKEYTKLHWKASSANRKYHGTITAKDILEVIKKSGMKCYWCGKTDLSGRDLTLEHLKRVNNIKYIKIACFSCNASRKSPCAKQGNQWEKSV